MQRKTVLLLLIFLIASALPGQAQDSSNKPLILPIASAPSPTTWLLGQPYGNTTGAFNFGDAWYSAGQGLHFGLDFPMPCGTPLVAVADGIVIGVDATSFGSAPHNLVLSHPDLGISTLYGHLLERPPLIRDQVVKQGDFVGFSGEPRSNCEDRPHLHFEVRSLDYQVTYNPVNFMNANWHTLMLIGPFSNPSFQQDMDNPRRWMSITDQPDVLFGGARLNNYNRTWPYPLDVRAPINPPLLREIDPLPADAAFTLREFGFGQCCPRPWWHPLDPNRLYVVDGVAGQRANVFEYTVDNTVPPTPIYEAPPMLLSPDGSYQVTRVNGQITIRNLSDMSEWIVQTEGVLPAISPDNSKLLWEVWRGDYLPGETAQTVVTWVSNLDGSNAQTILTQPGGWSVWLDHHRVLVVTPTEQQADTTLTVYDTDDGSSYALGTWDYLRGLSVSPGGERLMFYLTWQPDPNQNGVYVLDTQPGALPQQLPFFGDWRWRDADSVFYIPFDPSSAWHTLAYYEIPTGTDRYLTDPTLQPFQIANGDWSVSPDGNSIVFQNALDLNIWLLKLTGE